MAARVLASSEILFFRAGLFLIGAYAVRMQTIAIAITDPPLQPESGQTLEDLRILVQASSYGRILFAERQPGILIGGHVRNVTVRNCELVCVG